MLARLSFMVKLTMAEDDPWRALREALLRARTGRSGSTDAGLDLALTRFVDHEKRAGSPPERVVVDVKRIAESAGWRARYPSGDWVDGATGLGLMNVVKASMERYYAGPRPPEARG